MQESTQMNSSNENQYLKYQEENIDKNEKYLKDMFVRSISQNLTNKQTLICIYVIRGISKKKLFSNTIYLANVFIL